MPPPLTGEGKQDKGADGVVDAKKWLESTCRAKVPWDHKCHGAKLQFRKAAAELDSDRDVDYFSFDLGGLYVGGDLDGDLFLAEVKNYSKPRDQGAAYREFLAQCYRVEFLRAGEYRSYLWITWNPFNVNSWSELANQEYVRNALGEDGGDTALGGAEPDDVICKAVAERVIIVVLSSRQCELLALGAEAAASAMFHLEKEARN